MTFNGLMNCTGAKLAVTLLGAGATFDVALVVMLLQQAAVVSQLLVFVRVSQQVGPRRRTAAVLRQRPSRQKIKRGLVSDSNHRDRIMKNKREKMQKKAPKEAKENLTWRQKCFIYFYELIASKALWVQSFYSTQTYTVAARSSILAG